MREIFLYNAAPHEIFGSSALRPSETRRDELHCRAKQKQWERFTERFWIDRGGGSNDVRAAVRIN